MAAADYINTVQGFYISYYGRPADPAGLTYWTQRLDAEKGNLSAILNAFGTSAEATRRFGSGTTASQIDAIYQQSFGRAADAEGLAFYTGEITAGRMTLINAAKAILDGAKNTDLPIVANRLVAANTFTNALDTDAEKAGYSGDGAEAAARAWITTVTGDAASLTAAQATVNATITALLPQTFTLTVNADTWTGGSGNDTVSGVVSTLASANTLNVTDKLDGGAGTDSLVVSLNSDFSGFTTGFVKNIEDVKITNASTNALTFDSSGITGATGYDVTATSGNVTLTDTATGLKTLSLNGLKSATGTTAFSNTFAVGSAEREATALTDSVTLNLSGVGNAATSGGTARDTTVTLNATEVANVVSTGDNYVTFGGTDLLTLNASGAGTLTVIAVPTSLTSFDGSSASGAITATLSAPTANALKTVKTGSGNDSVTVSRAALTANAVLSGGDGTADKITLTSTAAGSTAYQMSGFETLALTTVSGGALAFSGSKVSGVSKITHTDATAQNVTFSSMGSAALTFESTGAAAAVTISSDHSGASTVNLNATSATITAATTAQAPSTAYSFAESTGGLVVNVGQFINTNADVTAAKASSVTLNVASGKNAAGTEQTVFDKKITAALASSISVTSDGLLSTGAEIDAAKATSATVTSKSTSAGALKLTTGDLTSLTSTASGTLDFTGSTFTKVQTASLTASAGTTTIVDLAAAANVTVGGAASSSTISLGELGGANNYDLTLNSSGLKGGLTVKDMAVNTGYNITANLAGTTGAVSFTDTIGDTIADGGTAVARNVTINASGLGGKLTAGAVMGTGTVTINAAGAKEASIGNVTGGDVTINVSGTTVTSSVGTTINAKASLDLTLHELAAGAGYTVGSVSGSTGLSIKLNGGVEADLFTINGLSTTTSIVVSGDLAAGDDTVTVNATSATAAQTINLSGLKDYKSSTINGSAAADTITGGSGVDLIYGGQGANVLAGGAGADAFVFNSGDSTATSVNTIQDLGATDVIYYGGAVATIQTVAVTNQTNVEISDKGIATFKGTATAYDTLVEKMTLIDAAVASGKIVFFSHDGSTYLMVDTGSATDGADVVVKLTGIQLTAAEATSVATNGQYASMGTTGLIGLGT